MIGRLLQWLRVPGFIKPLEYMDPETGEVILRVRTSPRYTILTVAGKELYFFRETGKLDGIGAMSLDAGLCLSCRDARLGASAP